MGDVPDAILYVAPFGGPLLSASGIRGSVSTAQAHVAEVWFDGATWRPPWDVYDVDTSGPGPAVPAYPRGRALAVRWAGAWVHDGWDRAFRSFPGEGGAVPVPSLVHARAMGAALVRFGLAAKVLEIHATITPTDSIVDREVIDRVLGNAADPAERGTGAKREWSDG